MIQVIVVPSKTGKQTPPHCSRHEYSINNFHSQNLHGTNLFTVGKVYIGGSDKRINHKIMMV